MINAKSSGLEVVGLLAAFLFSIGCGPDQVILPASQEGGEFAQAVCAARQACGCSDARFSSIADCEQTLAAAFDATVKRGLVRDDECFEEIKASDLISGCPVWPPDWPCTALRGTKGAGESCDTYAELLPFPASDCDDGLSCYAGTCVAEPHPLMPLGEGSRCQKDVGCGTLSRYCGGDGKCHSIRKLGEVCNDYMACETFTYCRGLGEGQTGICTERVAPDGACAPKDWNACQKVDGEHYWCSPETSSCVWGPPSVCLLTHPAALAD